MILLSSYIILRSPQPFKWPTVVDFEARGLPYYPEGRGESFVTAAIGTIPVIQDHFLTDDSEVPQGRLQVWSYESYDWCDVASIADAAGHVPFSSVYGRVILARDTRATVCSGIGIALQDMYGDKQGRDYRAELVKKLVENRVQVVVLQSPVSLPVEL